MYRSQKWLLVATLSLAACPAGDETDAADTDVEVADLCAPQAPSADTIEETQLNTTYPTPAGGDVADGTYDLARFEIYSPAIADDHVRARRIVFAGDTIVSINVDDGEAQPIQGGTFTTSGTDISFAIGCPATGAITLPYTVSGDEFWLFDTNEPNVQVYQRQ